MEKKIGKNVSSGAKKVEKIERENAETKKPQKKNVQKKSAIKQSAPETAQKKERQAAQKRVKEAKARNQKKEEKLMKKAELKAKKLEKKAKLKEKKLEHKAALAQKKAERKQKKIDKRAALKEKKIERRAQKEARRELLKNESKAERKGRLSREKKERLALKRQRAQARDKAREQKHKAREANRARRSENKKHKREQRTERKKHAPGFGGWLAAVISLGTACLVLATVVTAGAIRMNEAQVQMESRSRANLYELVSITEDMDNNLSKLRVSEGANEQRKLLTNLLVDSALLESALEKMPVDQVTATSISSFINDTGAYCRAMLAQISAGKKLTEKEHATLNVLYQINHKISHELNQIATHMSASDLRKFLEGGESDFSNRLTQMGDGMKGALEEMRPPFAQGNVGENRLAGLEEITESVAEERAREYFADYRVKSVRCTGETVARGFSCYNFVLTDENDVEIFVQITKNGGKLALFDTYEECKNKQFDLDTCDVIARKFLAEIGVEDMQAVWLTDAGMVANLTYVRLQDGVRIYSDTVRVRVCEEKGRVIGVEAGAYWLNAGTRSNLSPEMSESEAESRLSSELTPYATHLALIPSLKGERLCYEFACRSGEDRYIVYLDAKTGEELRVLHVENSAQGSYLH